jgi:hypothetical protein
MIQDILEKYDDNISVETDIIIINEIKKLNLTKDKLIDALDYMVLKYRESERNEYLIQKHVRK